MVSRLIGLVWRYRWQFFLVLGIQFVLLALGLTGLAMTGMGVDVIRYELESHTAPSHWPLGLRPPSDLHGMPLLILLGCAVMVMAVIRAVLNYFYGVCVARLVQGDIVVNLRSELYEKMQQLDFRFFDSNASSSLINRLTGDVQSVRLFVDGVIIPAVIMLLSLAIYLVYMLAINVRLTLACLAPMPMVWILSSAFSRAVHPKYMENRRLYDNLVLWLSECIRGIGVVKAFAFEKGALARFDEKNNAFREQQRSTFLTISLFNPSINFITQCTVIILLLYGGWLVIENRIPLGAGLIVFSGLLQQFAGQIANIGGITNSAQQSLAAAQRVFEILDAPLAIRSPENADPLENFRGELSFENVTFAYASQNSHALREVSFTAHAGHCIGIVGPTGSGKSSLLGLVPRFYDPESGVVRVDGRDVRDCNLDVLRSHVGIVFQESFLFAATVAENIAFGRPKAARSEVEDAARLAAADEFIRQLPQGYDTPLQEGGTSLSGGQRQRLALARALLHDPRILLLDDPTAAVDSHTEREILEGIDRALEGRTVLLATHRIAALRRADWLIVLDEGRIVQQGTPAALMASPGYFQTLLTLQHDHEKAA